MRTKNDEDGGEKQRMRENCGESDGKDNQNKNRKRYTKQTNKQTKKQRNKQTNKHTKLSELKIQQNTSNSVLPLNEGNNNAADDRTERPKIH